MLAWYVAISAHIRPSWTLLTISPGNSLKNHNNQPLVANDIAEQLRSGEQGLVGVMIESNLAAGNQKVTSSGLEGLKRGVSITDACIDWDTTADTLRNLAEAVRARREVVAAKN